MVTLAIQGTTVDEIDEWCIKRLQSRGFIVAKRGPWETPKQAQVRLKISKSKFRRRWRRYPRPQASDVHLGDSGKMVSFRSNELLDAFLRGPERAPSRVTAAKNGQGAGRVRKSAG